MTLVGAALSACATDPGRETVCADSTVYVVVPSDRADSVTGLQLSGEACANSVSECVVPAGSGCAKFAFRGTTIGSCTIDVLASTEPTDFTATFEMVRYPYCPGDYPRLATGNTIDVSDTEDAGGSG